MIILCYNNAVFYDAYEIRTRNNSCSHKVVRKSNINYYTIHFKYNSNLHKLGYKFFVQSFE